MESNTLLDYALFHLTPTRTRCDLVVFSRGKSEKLASGLVEPFISHLKFAKDQILKGGYSITLRPPTADAFWFTKFTFQRFVRFVNTPEILERFIQIEKEISQIASSIQSNEISSSNGVGHGEEVSALPVDRITKKTSNSYKSESKAGVVDGAGSEENSKFRLQRLLGTRKSLLLKEQAMAYARAKAAGYEMDRMDDLIYFANSFGASRLREACAGFMDLYQKKHTDSQWMDELAAMEACPPNELPYSGTSGITLAFENNGSAQSDGSSSIADKDTTAPHQTPPTAAKVQPNMSWSNQGPQFVPNFQIPFQQFPQYQGYPMPGMHPYYPGQGHWPRTADDPTTGLARETSKHRSRKSSKRKEKYHNVEGSQTSDDDEQSESSISNSGSDTDEDGKRGKKNSPSEKPYSRKNKKSSKTVVIRNINYITSKRIGETDSFSDGSASDESAILDGDSIRKDVVDAVASLGKHRHSKSSKNKNGRNQSSSIDNGINDDHGHIKHSSENGQTNENWNSFQSLLMNREESSPKAVAEKNSLDSEEQFALKISHDESSFRSAPTVNLESENVKVQHLTTDISVLIKRDERDAGRINMVDFSNLEEVHPSMKRRDSEDVQLLLSERLEGSRSSSLISDFGADSSLIRTGTREDWFVANRSDNLAIQETKQTILYEGNTFSSERDHFHMEESKRASYVDDSLMVQSRPAIDDHQDLEWKTDISMLADLTMSPPSDAAPNVSHASGTQEPDDLCVVLERDSMMERHGSWTQEMDYDVEISFTEADKRSSAVEINGHAEETHDIACKSTKKAVNPAPNSSGKDTRSKISKGNNMLKSKKTPAASRLMVQKSKLEKEEDIRKRMEELAIQRQKRIAERTAASGLTSARSKTLITGSKTASSGKLGTQPVPKTVSQLKKTSLRAASLVNT